MTSPIPRAAAPVVWFIRWWVKKPKNLPWPLFPPGRAYLQWYGNCPLGLLPFAANQSPDEAESAGLDSKRAFRAFSRWWDSQTDARAAVDAVWGKG